MDEDYCPNEQCEGCFTLEKADNGHLLQINFSCWDEEWVEFICFSCSPDKSEWIKIGELDQEQLEDLLLSITEGHAKEQPKFN